MYYIILNAEKRVFWNIFSEYIKKINTSFYTIIIITIRVDVPRNCVTNHFIGEQILLKSGMFM